MKRKLNWLLCSTLAIGGITFVTAEAADEAAKPATPAPQATDGNLGQPGAISSDAQRAAAHEAGSLALPMGSKNSGQNANAPDLSNVVVNATEAAVEKGEFDDVVNTLVDQDRNRLGDWKSFDFKTLDGRIAQLRQQFKDKYGEDDIDLDAEKVFANAQAAEGEIEDPLQFVKNWPVKAGMATDAQTAAAGAARDPGTAQATDSNRVAGNVSDDGAAASVKVGDATVGGQVKTDDAAATGTKSVDDDTRTQGNIEKGRNVAVLRLPAAEDAPDITVSLIRELTGWKIDIPNDRSLQMVHDDLLKHLTHVSENAASWPADKDQARGLIARHVMMGIYGIDMPQRKS